MLNYTDIIRILIPLGVLVLMYFGWVLYITIAKRTAELGVKHTLSSLTFFDNLFVTLVISVFVARLARLLPTLEYLDSRNWSILPYDRFGDAVEWLGNYPWRILSLMEGIEWWLVWPVAMLIIIRGLTPLSKAIKALKTDKKETIKQLKSKYLYLVFIVLFTGTALTVLSVIKI